MVTKIMVTMCHHDGDMVTIRGDIFGEGDNLKYVTNRGDTCHHVIVTSS